MKILVVSQYFYPEQMRINDIVERLVKEGNEVTVLTGLPNYPEGKVYKGYESKEKRSEEIFGAKVIRCPLVPRGNNIIMLALNYITFAFFSCLKARSIERDFDVIYVYQLSPVFMMYPARLLKRLTGKRIVLYCLDMWPESFKYGGITEKSLLYKIIHKISKKLYHSCDMICTTSYTHKEYMMKVNEIPKEKIEVLYQYETEIEHTKMDFPKDKFNVSYVGNMGKLQCIDNIIDAAELLKDKNILFHLMGSGSELERCREQTKIKNLDNVIFYGQVTIEQGHAAIEGSDINIICMRAGSEVDYPFPGKIQTAIYCATPVVFAANSEGSRFIEKNECGVACVPENAAEFAKAISSLLEDKATLEHYSNNAHRVYSKYFSSRTFIYKLTGYLKDEQTVGVK